MKEVYEFLKKCGTYYFATVDGDRPRVRPFGTVDIYDGRLYIQTGKSKDVYKQMEKNPKVEICGVMGEEWIRVSATAVLDGNYKAGVQMLDNYPELKAMYSPDDGNTTVFYLKDATATIYSEGEPKVIKF